MTPGTRCVEVGLTLETMDLWSLHRSGGMSPWIELCVESQVQKRGLALEDVVNASPGAGSETEGHPETVDM